MKRIDSRQYKILQKFCRDLFKNENYISEKRLNLLIQQQLNPCSTRYRRNLIELQLLSEKNKLFYPGEKLYHFKQNDTFTINKLMKYGEVKIVDNEIHLIPKNNDTNTITDEIELPGNWDIRKKTKTKLIFNVKSITRNH